MRKSFTMPKSLAKAGKESSEQRALFSWASHAANLGFEASLCEDLTPFYETWDRQLRVPDLVFLFAIPNGGLRDPVTASNLVAEGVKRGAPDVCLPVVRRGLPGLYIELKRREAKTDTSARTRRKGVTSTPQDAWRDFLLRQGYWHYVCYGWEEARDAIIFYMTQESYSGPSVD